MHQALGCLFFKVFEVACYAFGMGVGILSQDGYLIAFNVEKLNS